MQGINAMLAGALFFFAYELRRALPRREIILTGDARIIDAAQHSMQPLNAPQRARRITIKEACRKIPHFRIPPKTASAALPIL